MKTRKSVPTQVLPEDHHFAEIHKIPSTLEIKVGMPLTMFLVTDYNGYVVQEISPSGKTIYIRPLECKRKLPKSDLRQVRQNEKGQEIK